jgi:hypothetical protein
MKRLLRILLPAALALVAIAAFAMNSGEGISVSYSPKLDASCAIIRGSPIHEEWRAELTSRLDEYRALWGGVGPRLLAEAEAITGLPKPARANVRLTLCDVPSQSILGISVNMRFALKSFTSTPVPLRYKVDTQFHELLHRMLDGHIPEKSRLLAGHPNASECVRNHLHLLALQKAVLLRLQEDAALDDVVRIDSSLPSDCYKQAWEIVNASDTEYLLYVAEVAQ